MCPNCQNTSTKYTLKIIPTSRSDNFFPKYIPQVKELCASCGKYKKFATQTPELIEMVNQWLENYVMQHGEQTANDYEAYLNK